MRFRKLLVGVAPLAGLLLPTPSAAHTTLPHGPVPRLAPSAGCLDHQGCIFDENGQKIDGYKYSASSAPGVGHVGWWEHVSYQPPGTVFRIRACVGRIPFQTEDCGPAAEVVVPHPPSVEERIRSAFGPAGAKAVEVARCESGLNPGARRPGSQFWGLFQIGVSIHAGRIRRMGYTAEDMLKAGPNIAVARALYNEQGWRPWECA